MTEQKIKSKIARNRNSIHNALISDLPTKDIAMIVKSISNKNKELIEELNKL